MNQIKSVSLLFLIVISTTVSAQLKRANKYYDRYDYAKAIQLYKKVLKKGDDAEALEKIANACRLTKNYQEAETYYARLTKQTGDIKPINHFYYGEVLRNNRKITEAKEEYSIYLKAFPNDKVAQESVKACDQINVWIKSLQQYQVSPVDILNTPHSEFCPVVYKNKLVFTADRENDILNNNYDPWNKQPFLNQYYVDILESKDGDLKLSDKIKQMKWPITSEFHDGPVCFSADENTLYITRVNYQEKKKDKDFVNRPKLFISEMKGNKWGEMKSFKYNSDAYAIAHPSISFDGQWLFFASDMPGGYGGTDIYVCQKEGDVWGKPQNLGGGVNTDRDEVFPYIRKDGILFFSSNGLAGFGGLDIFSSKKVNGRFIYATNLGAPVNSFTDDFGIVFTNDSTKGYFSSDRTTGKGADDIYNFIVLPDKTISLEGRLLGSPNINDPLKKIKLQLLAEDGSVLGQMETDSLGYFIFTKLDPDKHYNIKIDEADPQLVYKDKVYMTDKNNKIVRVSILNKRGERFVFERLPIDRNELAKDSLASDETFAGNLMYGENPSKPMANTKVNLVNDKGEIIQTTTTNAVGGFVFRHLPSDQNFAVKLDETDTQLSPDTKITLTNKDGKEIQSSKMGYVKQFAFFFLGSDQNSLKQMSAEDNDLRYDFKGKLISEDKSPIANSKVNLVNEKRDVLATVNTDAKGGFQFTNLPLDKNILFTIDENDSKLKLYRKIYLTDLKGNIIKVFTRGDNGKFDFTLLPNDINNLTSVYVADPLLSTLNFSKKDTINAVENIYYNLGDYKILPEAKRTLDKVVNILTTNSKLIIQVSSHTDCRASNEYNLNLSQQRANAVVDYLSQSGIAKRRISGKGYGETKLINKCSDGVECTEEEHAKNRRTEFKIYLK